MYSYMLEKWHSEVNSLIYVVQLTNMEDQDKVKEDTLWQTYHQSQVPWMIKGPFRGRLEMMKVHQISDKLRWTKKTQMLSKLIQIKIKIK